jgi:SAM-dependent MidA family methyltransferase
LPDAFEGVLIANELLDAMPVHQVVMREEGLREVLVDVDPAAGALRLVEAPPSTPALQRYLDLAGVRLEPGARAEINLRAVEWIRNAARRLRRGFMILIDYGHEARELYSVTHATGTLTAFRGHRSTGPERAAASSWLSAPGEQDLTAHVDFTSVRAAAEAEGMDTIAFLDQTYFLLGLFQSVAGHDANTSADRRSAKASAGHDANTSADRWSAKASAEHDANTSADRWSAKASAGHDANTSADRWSAKASAERHHELKTLIMPGGLGSTMKVLILGKDVGTPPLKGCSFKVRVT